MTDKIEVEMRCGGIGHDAVVIDGVIHSDCHVCNGMLLGDCIPIEED